MFETILSGDKANIENTGKSKVALKLVSSDGYQVEIELEPGQVIGFTSGPANVEVIITNGEPEKILIIKPEAAS